MKRFSIILIIILLLSSCTVDFYAKVRPPDYKNTTWIAKECNMYFYVDQNSQCLGKMELDETIYNIELYFRMGKTVAILNTEKIIDKNRIKNFEILFNADCKFSEQKFIISFEGRRLNDNIPLNLKKITFIRTDGEIIPDWAK
ncbi:hypothetical protein FACS1894132_07110 [Clostridia bacterium]|nr:hypothetical protein FACS1894132_07110 [Clostridia bacterium]